jgi:FkbM family methyltransferase
MNTTLRVKSWIKPVFSSLVTRLWGDPEGFVKFVTRRGAGRGMVLRLDLQRRLEYGYWLGTYDQQILEAIACLCQPGWTVWDWGTYLGYYTCNFARFVGPRGHVVAFEPDPTNLARTRENVALNGFTNVTFRNAAIGTPAGEVDFVVSGNTNSHLPGMWLGATRERYGAIERVQQTIRVRCLSLDEALGADGAGRPDLVKIDIEGAEQFALPHTDKLCREVKPHIVLELHNPECDAAAWEWSRRVKYTLLSLNTGRLVERREDTEGTLLCSPESRQPVAVLAHFRRRK